jgi:predicted transcriptional regulator
MDESDHEWQLTDSQVEEVKKALAKADAGDFASDEEVAQMINKWSRRQHA